MTLSVVIVGQGYVGFPLSLNIIKKKYSMFWFG